MVSARLGNTGTLRSMRVPIVVLLTLASCGGEVTGEADDASSTIEGTCAVAADSLWNCVLLAPSNGLTLPQCPTAIESGSSCSDQSITTTNPSRAGVVSPTECFTCGGNGSGTDWRCTGSTWQAAGLFSCTR